MAEKTKTPRFILYKHSDIKIDWSTIQVPELPENETEHQKSIRQRIAVLESQVILKNLKH